MVARLRALRATGHPLLLIALWATLEAATIAWTALVPGGPWYSQPGAGSLGGAIFWTLLIVLFVAVGNRFGWWLAIVSDTVGIGFGVVAGIYDPGIGAFGVAVLQAAALWLIWSPSIETYVKSGLRSRLTVTPPAH